MNQPRPSIESETGSLQLTGERFCALLEKVREYRPQDDIALLRRAYEYSAFRHGTQTRASGEPFEHGVEERDALSDVAKGRHRQVEFHRQKVFLREASIDARETREAFQQKTATDEKHDGERDFTDDEKPRARC